jgi:hypothetical protein
MHAVLSPPLIAGGYGNSQGGGQQAQATHLYGAI